MTPPPAPQWRHLAEVSLRRSLVGGAQSSAGNGELQLIDSHGRRAVGLTVVSPLSCPVLHLIEEGRFGKSFLELVEVVTRREAATRSSRND